MGRNDFDRSRPVRSSATALAVLGLIVTTGAAAAFASWRAGATASPPAAGRPHVPDHKTLPVYFEENEGQTDARVRFLSRTPGYTIFLTPKGSVVTLHKVAGKGDPQRQPHPAFTTASVWMNLAGARSDVQIEGVEPQPGRVNYIIGADAAKWRTNIPTYARVRYRSVYPGIDLVYYGSAQTLEYDLIVAPGADPGVIGIELREADSICLDAAGAVVIGTAAGNVTMRKPHIYQLTRTGARTELGGRYVLRSKSRLGFEVAAYDRKRPLVIDPVVVLAYSTYLGGSGNEFDAGDTGYGIAVDAKGSAYVTGQTFSSNFPTKNPFQGTIKSDIYGNAFVTKFSTKKDKPVLEYSTYLGGSYGESGSAIAVDSKGSAYVTGWTGSSNFPTKNAFQAANKAFAAGRTNAFVTKFSASGSSLVYSTYLGGSGGEIAEGIAVDSSGSAYVTGQTLSSNFPTKNPFQATNKAFAAGGTNAFVTKFNPAGSSLVYSTYLGGSSEDEGHGIEVDAKGSAYVVGETSSSNFPTTKNAFQGTLKSKYGNAFVTKFNPAGSSLLYSTYLGGSGGGSGGRGIAVDAKESAYVVGETYSSNFPTTKKAFQSKLKSKCCGNAFVTKFSPAGSSLLYSTYLGGSGGDTGRGIAVDAMGSAYVAGQTFSKNFPTKNAFQSKLKSIWNAFVTKFSPAGSSLVYSTYLGGSGGILVGDAAYGIAVAASGSAYVTGYTSSSNFPITKNTFQATNNGYPSADNAFVSKLRFRTPTPTPTPTRKPTPTPTRKPTPTPTRKPTPTPTRKPTPTPIRKPTPKPT